MHKTSVTSLHAELFACQPDGAYYKKVVIQTFRIQISADSQECQILRATISTDESPDCGADGDKASVIKLIKANGNGNHAKVVDLRSDTVTKPTDAMREAAFKVRTLPLNRKPQAESIS